MKQFLSTAAFALTIFLASTSCTKDKVDQVVDPSPNNTVQKVSLSQTANIDLNLVAASTKLQAMESELSMSGTRIENFTLTNESRKIWHLGKLGVGIHRVNLHVNGPEGASIGTFIRYDVSNGVASHSISPTPVIGNNLAFDLIVNP